MNIQKISFLLIVLLLIIVLIIKKANKKVNQNQGEIEVNKVLEKIKGARLLEDVMVKRSKGTSQIDHILITKKGIFVIETKDFSGKIIGEEDSKFWLQKLRVKENYFYSPIKQNYGHVKAVEEIIKRRNICISLIVFTNKSNIKKIKSETDVIQLKNLKKFIRRYKTDVKLSKAEIERIYKDLKRKDINSKRAIKKHIKTIRKNIE